MSVEGHIAPLSQRQLIRLHQGQAVRVKHGDAHVVPMTTKDHKKMMKAHLCGKGISLVLPPHPSIGAGLATKARPVLVNKTVSPIKQAASDRAVSAISNKGAGVQRTRQMFNPVHDAKVEARWMGAGLATNARPVLVNKTVSPIKQAASDRAVSAISNKGAGVKQIKAAAVQFSQGRPFKLKDGTAPMSVQAIRSGRPFGGKLVKGSVEAREHMAHLRSMRKDGGPEKGSAAAKAHMAHLRAMRKEHKERTEGGKISRMKKFNRWTKAVGQKFLPINKNLKPIKQAASARAADAIMSYNNPTYVAEQNAQTGIDLFNQLRTPQYNGEPVYATPIDDPILKTTNYYNFPVPPAHPASVHDDLFTPAEMKYYAAGLKPPQPTIKGGRLVKGSQAARDKMTAVRAKKQSGGAMMPAGY